MNVVEINNVTNTFSDHIAINDLLRTVPGGSIGGFIGPNRFANTTTLRMVMRIFPSSMLWPRRLASIWLATPWS